MEPHNEKALNKLSKSDRRFKFFLYSTLVVLFSTVVASIILGAVLLGQLKDIADRIEETQKTNLCVILIKPEQRTPEGVSSCVDQNTAKDKDEDFNFNDTNGNTITDSSSRNSSSTESRTLVEQRFIEKQPIQILPPKDEDPEPTPVRDTVKVLDRQVDSVTGKVTCILEGDTIRTVGERCL